jgi:predicted ester cyclase
MNAIDVVKASLAAVETGRVMEYEESLTEDMVFAGPVPQPVGKREFVALQSALVMAMPDWKFNGTDFKQMGDKVTAMLQITGTQTGELSLPMPGLPKLMATGKRVSLPAQLTTFTVINDKISRVEADADPKAGVPGILSQLGVPLPQM